MHAKRKTLLAIGAAIAAACANTVMAALTKVEAEKDISTFMILFWRSFYAIFVLFAVLIFSAPKFTIAEKVKTHYLTLHLIRDIAGFIGVFLYYYVLRDLSLTVATLLYFTIPLFMPFIGYFWKGHAMPRLGWIGIVIGFTGVLCVIKPGHQLFHYSSLLGLLSGLTIAIGQFAAHLLTKTDSNVRINFYYYAFITLITIPFLFTISFDSWKIVYPIDFFYFFWIGIFSLIYLLFITLALKSGPPPLVTTFLYTVVIFTMLLDWLVWKIVAHWLTWLGAILVIIGVVLMYTLHQKEASHEKERS